MKGRGNRLAETLEIRQVLTKPEDTKMTKTDKIKASIIGVTGFTGSELLRVLLAHPDVEIAHLVSRQYEDAPLAEVFPRLSHIKGLKISNTPHDKVAADSDIVFLCLPHVASQEVIETFLGKTKLIDMSADFRLDDAAMYEKYYKTPHQKPEWLEGRFIYGIPELNRKDIKTADAVANPGCNALLVQMMLLPFAGNIKHADVFLLTGTTGGGAAPRDPMDHPVLTANVRSYQINTHRHTPEIIRTAQIKEEQLNFTPTAGPFLRGIFATAFVECDDDANTSVFNTHPFVRITDKVELTNVVSTNYCDLSFAAGNSGQMIAQGAIDNLLRGAAGTAVQNMNLMFGLAEETGLTFTSATYP